MADTNPFDDAAQTVLQGQTIGLRNNVANAVTQNAQTASQHAVLASQLGIPPDSVAADPNTAKQQATLQHFDANKVANNFPHLAQFMGDQWNANQVVSNNDTNNLANVEASLKSAPTPPLASAPPNITGNTPNNNSLSANLAALPGAPYELFKNFAGGWHETVTAFNRMTGWVPSVYDKVATQMTGQNPGAGDWWQQHMVDPRVAEYNRTFQNDPNAPMVTKVADNAGGLATMLNQAILTGGSGEAVPAAKSALQYIKQLFFQSSKAMAVPAATTAVNTGTDVYDQTHDFNAALKSGGMAGLTTDLAGMTPLGLEGNLFMRMATGFPTSILQSEASRRANNLVLPDSMQQKPMTGEDAFIQGLMGSVMSGALGHSNTAERSVQQQYEQARQSYDAVQGGQSIQKLSDAAQSTQLRTNNPQAFKEFVKSVTDDGHLPEVFVDGQTFVNALHQSGINMDELQQKMPDVASQIQEALHTNGDVRIPTEDYATHLAGAQMDAALIPHMKTDPDGMTYQQGLDHLANQQSEMEQQAQEVTQKQKEANQRADEIAAIADQRFQQLEAQGRYTPSQNREMAQLHAQFFDAMSDRMGLSPKEMADKYPLRLVSEAFQDHVLNQPSNLSPEHAEIERQAFDQVNRHGDDMVRQYFEKNGNLIDPDKVKELFPAYVKDNSLANAVHEPSSLLAKRIYTSALATNEGKPVVFTAGGGGSGKSEAMPIARATAGLHEGGLTYDSTLSSFGSAKKRIDQALDTGAPVHIVYTNRPVGKAFDLAMGRPRVVPLSTLADAHLGASNTIRELAQHYADNPNVHINVVNNLGEVHEMHAGQLADVPHYGYNDIERDLHERASQALKSGKINQARYDALTAVSGSSRGDRTLQSGERGQDLGGLSQGTGRSGEGQDGRLQDQSAEPVQNRRSSGPDQEVNRGFYNPETHEMGLLKNADLSTFLHESGHYFLEVMHDMASHVEAPEGIKADFDKLLQHFGVEGATPEERLADWSNRTLEEKRDGHERFAEDFEQYLFNGKAPTPELQSMFSRFRSWLMSVYGSLKGKLSPEVQGVMDRMFASQEAITEAERVRNYMVPDLSAEHGEQIDQYKQLGHEATEEAIADMQARSLRDMKWTSNAIGRKIKELQKSADAQREAIRAEVTKEVEATPVRAAQRDLKEIQPPTDVEKDLIAEQHGFADHVAMNAAIKAAGSMKDQIAGMTDQRMLERHGDLVDPVSVQRAAEAAIHNEVRARMMATGLKMFSKSPMSVNEINKAAKAAADTAIAAKKVGDVRPAQYSAAEAKANKELLKLAPKDPQGAVAAQRAALLNNRLFKSANEAVTDVQKGLQYLKRFTRESTRSKIDVDVRDQIDDILQRFDLRANPTDAPSRPQRNLQDWVESQVSAGMMPSVTPEMLQPAFKMPYREMTVEQFRGMVDSIKSMEELGRTRQTIMVNGEKQILRDYADSAIIPKLMEYGEHFTPEQRYLDSEQRGLGKFQTGLEALSSFARAANTELKPQDYTANLLDRHEVLGPIYRSIFEPVLKGSYDKAAALKSLSDSFAAKAKELGKDWQKSLHDAVINNKLMDPDLSEKTGQDIPMKINRSQMLMIALHSGNESNFDKLTKGYGWDPKDVWTFLNANMSAKDIDAVNHLWELNDKHWPEVEKLYRDMGQTTPPKIEARPTTLDNGELRGGYARITYDPARSRRGAAEAADNAKEIAANGVSVSDYFKRTGTANGAMNARMDGYTDKINLDFHTISQAFNETLHDLSYRRALVDANKLLNDAKVKDAFYATYGPEQWKAVNTWLGRVANSANADLNASSLAKVLQYSRTGMVINGIGFNVATVGKHGLAAGLKSIGFMAGGGEKFFASRMASMFHDYSNQVADAKAKFSEIAARAMQQDRDFAVTSSSMFEPDSFHAKLDRAGHAMIAALDLFSAVPTAHAAYDRAVTEGVPVSQGGTGEPMSHEDAVAYANKVVREAHGSNVEAARSNFMNNPDIWMKQFGALYGFMNNSYGQMANITSRMMTPGISKPVTFAQAFAAIIVPAIATEAMSSHFHKDDGEGWGAWMAKAIASEVAGMVPFVRDAVSMVKDMKHAGEVPVESWLNSYVDAGVDVKDQVQGKGNDGKTAQDLLNVTGTTLHLPLGQLAKTLKYYINRDEGKIPEPENGLHQVTDPLLGAPPKK